MDHKDLLNDIISGMTTPKKEEISEIPEDEMLEPPTDGEVIKFKLITGAEYELDATKFDWNKAVRDLPQMIDNVETFRQMMGNAIIASTDKSDDGIAFVEKTIKMMEELFAGFQMTPDYTMYNDSLTRHQIMMFMLYDMNNVYRTIIEHVKAYQTVSVIASIFETKDEPNEEESSDPLSDIPLSDTVYKVEASACEGGMSIDSIVATEDYPYDNINVVDDSGNGGYTVYVVAKTVKDARETALKLLNINHGGYEYDPLAETSGLLEE